MRPAIACLILATTLSACGGGDEAATKGDEQAVVATQSDAEIPAWLSHTDPMETGRWLASREAGHMLAADDAQSSQMRRSLGRAQSFFIEDPRMIANRTVQLGQMLAEAGSPERYEALIEGLTRVAQRARGKQLYGELCQHYYNTRRQGDDRSLALARLSERYGSRTQAGPGEAAPQTGEPTP